MTAKQQQMIKYLVVVALSVVAGVLGDEIITESSTAEPSVANASETATTSSPETSAVPDEGRVFENLCDYNDGEYCEPCPTCPQGDEGYLCCEGGYCVPVKIDEACKGIKGYCHNYTRDESGNATCHDE